MGLIQRQEQAEGFTQGVDVDERRQRLSQRAEVPLADGHLVAEGVTPFMVGMVADECGVEVVEEGERPEVEGNAQDRHVVGVHDAMTKPVGLPLGDQFGIALHDLAEHRKVRLRLLQAFREVQGQDVFTQLFLLFRLLGVIEVFEMPEADMARRQPWHHRCAFLFFAPHRGVGPDHTQRTAAGDAQRVQRFAGEEFANGRTQHGTAVTHARVGGHARAFEVHVPMLARVVVDLAQQ